MEFRIKIYLTMSSSQVDMHYAFSHNFLVNLSPGQGNDRSGYNYNHASNLYSPCQMGSTMQIIRSNQNKVLDITGTKFPISYFMN